MADTATPVRLQFGPFLADFRACELRKDGRRIRLQEKPMLLLWALASKPGEVISREDLQKLLWPGDTFVDFEIGLNAVVRKLREALADSPENPKYIETIPKRGYRFVAPVAPDGREEQALSPKQTPADGPPTDTSLGRRTIASLVETVSEYRRAKRFWMMIAAVLGIVGLAVAFGHVNVAKIAALRDRGSVASGPPTIRSLAVLPLQNLSNDSAQEYLSDGMTDALITDLAQIASVKVISRTSSMQYKETKKSLPEIARELNVDGIVEGTVQRSGDRVRITAQLIHGPSDKHLWANSYEREMRDVLTLEREVTADIADRVQARITLEREPVQPRPVNPKALDAYLQGNYHLNTNAGPHNEELRKAGEFFQQAINADPNFAPAYVGLAEAHYTVWWESDNDLAVMTRASERALVLDPNSSDAWVELGLVRLADWDWVAAEEQTRRAIILNPNSANGHEYLGEILDALGKSEEGWREHIIAQQLDPNQDHLVWILRLRGEYDRAIDILKGMSERRPQDPLVYWNLSENYFLKGLYAEWANELGRSISLFFSPKIADEFTRSFKSSGYKGALRIWARELELLAQNKEAYFPGVLAEEYAALGDKDRAFYWLEQGCTHSHRSVADPILPFVKVDPSLAVLHSDPRFVAVLRCMRLPP